MTDLFRGQTMTELYRFRSGGAAYTFSFGFQPDKVVFVNLTAWTSTAGLLPISTWYRDETVAAHASQQRVVDTSAGASFNFVDLATNGFTVADTSGGITSYRSLISGVTKADPCVVTTSAAHGLQTNQIIRITDLGQLETSPLTPTSRGMDELNDNRYSVTVINSTSFSLQDPVTGENIDSTNFVTWVAGGRINLESRVISLNNPQVAPYSSTPYVPTTFKYDPITYKLTAGTSVMGAATNRFVIEVYKFGNVTDLGSL
jgi:hypothetical protein